MADHKEISDSLLNSLLVILQMYRQSPLGELIKQSGFYELNKFEGLSLNHLSDFIIDGAERPVSDIVVGFYKFYNFVESKGAGVPFLVKHITRELNSQIAYFLKANPELAAALNQERIQTAKSMREFPDEFRLVNAAFMKINEVNPKLLGGIFAAINAPACDGVGCG